QMSSHLSVQQKGSLMQTLRQQVASSQPGLTWPAQQDPAPGSPQLPQSWLARVLQEASQVVSQQLGCAAHTAAQQSAQAQPGPAWGAKQLPESGLPHTSPLGHGPQLARSCSRSRIPTMPSPLKSSGPVGLVPHCTRTLRKSMIATWLSPLVSHGQTGAE